MKEKEKQIDSLDSLTLIGLFLTAYTIFKDAIINKLSGVVIVEIVIGSFLFSVFVYLIVHYIMEKR
ncbi:MAG: hypothetical protein OIN85_10525 [Candidatus Methanoperedens sp.]|nr:hypothetical protein [Candidatus Methanoperedens sp.]